MEVELTSSAHPEHSSWLEKQKKEKAEISNYVFIIQLSAHKRTTEMVGYVLGKLLQKYKLDKRS